jgi:hypothetical protein
MRIGYSRLALDGTRLQPNCDRLQPTCAGLHSTAADLCLDAIYCSRLVMDCIRLQATCGERHRIWPKQYRKMPEQSSPRSGLYNNNRGSSERSAVYNKDSGSSERSGLYNNNICVYTSMAKTKTSIFRWLLCGKSQSRLMLQSKYLSNKLTFPRIPWGVYIASSWPLSIARALVSPLHAAMRLCYVGSNSFSGTQARLVSLGLPRVLKKDRANEKFTFNEPSRDSVLLI